MVEERKHEDRLLRMECGWGSQSGLSASQVSMQQRRHSVDAGPYIQESQDEIMDEQSQIWSARDDISHENQSQQEPMFPDSQIGYRGGTSEPPEQQILPRQEISLASHRTPFLPISVRRSVTPAEEIPSGEDLSNFSAEPEGNENALQQREDPNKPVLDMVEENDEDEGIPWF